MNFHKQIMQLQEVRKFVDTQAVGLQEETWIAANLSDISYSITIAIKDLIRINKILKERNND